ncbi:hypothetical protein NB701_001975 [Pantoea ananatis]|nr:hypothetical protein [Pantoea ananatis]
MHGLTVHSLKVVDDRYTTLISVLMMKRVFNLSLRALQGFVDSIFKLIGLPLVLSGLLSGQPTSKNRQYQH